MQDSDRTQKTGAEMEKKMIRQRASNALGECPGLIIFAFSSRFRHLFDILRAGKIDTFKKGAFLPTYIRKRFAQKLFNTTSDYDK